MSAATAARDAQRKDSDIGTHPVAAATKIYKHTFVSARIAAGMAYPGRNGTATDIFLGVAYETKDNTAGSAGAISIRVYKTGSYVFALAGAVATDLGLPVYISDDSTLTKTSTNAQLAGYIDQVIDGSNVRVVIDLAVR